MDRIIFGRFTKRGISIGKDGWIDFENEISKVVQTIDKVNREIQKSKTRRKVEIKDISFYEKQLFESIELDINQALLVME